MSGGHAHRGHRFSFTPAGAYCETCEEYLVKANQHTAREESE